MSAQTEDLANAVRSPGAVPDTTEAIVIGASAGGVQALLELLPGLPKDFGPPIVVVLHLPDDRESRLADVLAYRLAMPAREARDKEPIAPSTVYVAPAGYHLLIEEDRSFALSGEPPVHYSRPSIDVLMASAADVYGEALLAILLTGANNDGAAGLKSVQRRGGFTVVQDPADAQVATMPRAAISGMRPDAVLPLAGIRALLVALGAPA